MLLRDVTSGEATRIEAEGRHRLNEVKSSPSLQQKKAILLYPQGHRFSACLVLGAGKELELIARAEVIHCLLAPPPAQADHRSVAGATAENAVEQIHALSWFYNSEVKLRICKTHSQMKPLRRVRGLWYNMEQKEWCYAVCNGL